MGSGPEPSLALHFGLSVKPEPRIFHKKTMRENIKTFASCSVLLIVPLKKKAFLFNCQCVLIKKKKNLRLQPVNFVSDFFSFKLPQKCTPHLWTTPL